MKVLIAVVVALAACTLVCAETKQEDYEAHVVQNETVFNEDNGYKYEYGTSNNIIAKEESDGETIVEGSYSYIDPDGKLVFVSYIAGAGIGFKPIGNVIHPEIAASIELNLKNPPISAEEAAKYDNWGK